MERWGFFPELIALAGSGLIFAQSAPGQASTNQFQFNDYLLVPVRVHLLAAKDSPAIQTTLTEGDITRILKKVNGVWAQAGLCFYRESLLNGEAANPENFAQLPAQADRGALLELRPVKSRATNMFHVYYLKNMSMNGIYFPEGIFVKDTASLRKVEGGIDEPIPRVTSHELGHAFGLQHRQNTTNLMASGTTGTWLNVSEINQAREVAKRFEWIEVAQKVMKRADQLFDADKRTEAAELYCRLATIPLNTAPVELAKKRAAKEATSDLN